MVSLSSIGGAGWQFFDNNGDPLAGGKLYTYNAGTTTPAVTYTSSTGAIPNTNPIILDSNGRPASEIWMPEAATYKFVLTTSADVLIWTKDNIPGIFASDVINAANVAYNPPFSGAVTSNYTVANKLSQTVSVMDFGAVGDGVTDSTAAFNAAITFSNGQTIYVPPGTYRVSNVTGTDANFVGAGADVSLIELSTTSTAPLFTVGRLALKNLTLSDRGRASMDHTLNPGVYLCVCTDAFLSDNCNFLTDRSVLSQTPATDKNYAVVKDCFVERVSAPITNESDAMNIFTCFAGVSYINFDNLQCEGLVARSVINATYTATAANNAPAIASITNCRFEYIHNSGGGQEVKCIFLQGYTTTVQNNDFVDCFGRHIDVLGNYDTALTNGVYLPATIENNLISYSIDRQSATGSTNTEAGSIYCRYANATVQGNICNYTNLLITSSGYHSIVVRHGYTAAYIQGNTVIAAKGHAVLADLSNQIDTDNASVYIIGNTINSSSSIRAPIDISNDSATKTFGNIVIRDNTIRYSLGSTDIEIGGSIAHATSFAYDNVTVEGNKNVIFNAFDRAVFMQYPRSLIAPNTDISITVDPAGTNMSGVLTSLSDAVSCARHYRCRALTVQLAPSVTTTQTLTGPLAIVQQPQTFTVLGDNGSSGRIRFYTAGTEQNNVAITLNNNRVVFTGCIFNSDSASSTTALLALFGSGFTQVTNCEAQYGEYYVDSRGPSFSIKGGTINNINLGSSAANGVLFTLSNNLVSCSIEDVSGSSNNRLYNFTTPTVLVYENLSLGTTAGLKTYTLVV